MDVNNIIGRPYDSVNWNCYTLVQTICGTPDIGYFHENILKDAKKFKDILERYKERYCFVVTPEDYDIVLMGTSHAGVYIEGGVLHTSRETNTLYEPLHIVEKRFKNIRFIRVNK